MRPRKITHRADDPPAVGGLAVDAPKGRGVARLVEVPEEHTVPSGQWGLDIGCRGRSGTV